MNEDDPRRLFDLSGKRAFVTGASTGLGRRFGWTLARAGAEVILAARSVEKLADLGASIAAFGGRFRLAPLDVRDRAAIRACVEATEADGPIDVLVNNAGIAVVKAPERYTDEDWDSVYETNLRGPWALAQAVIKHRVADGRPCSIVNISSVLGLRPLGHLAPYAAAKAGLINLGRDLCVDLAARGIRINALAPGYFETEMNRDWLKSPAGEKLRGRIPTGRFGQPEDLDGAILFLASDASRFMNGNVLTVDGGHSAGL
jgi:NAD(P)-dependent dehydrogenase (short-subunit alcohol dehydrogenase family)